MKKVLQYFLVFIICWAWALPLRAQLFADHSRDEYQNNFWLKDTVKLVYKGGVKGKDSLRTLDLRFKGNNSIFRGKFDASEVRFDKTATFSSAVFQSNAAFKYVKFNDNATFSSAVFQGNAAFKYVKFNNNANFSSAVFQDDAIFKDVKFNNNASFSSAVFQDDAIFQDVKFYGKVDFFGVEFKQVPKFINTNFVEGVSFKGVKVPNKMLFIEVDISDTKSGIIDLSGIDTGGKLCYIDLRGTNVRKVMLDYTKFQIYFDSDFKAIKGNDTTYIKKMYEDLIFQQYTYDFQEGYQKAVKEYKAWKQNMRAQIKAGTWRGVFNDKPINSAIWWMFAVMMLMILFVAVLLPMRITSLLTKLTNAQDTTKPVMVPAQKIVQNVERGTELWQDYEADHASENEHFWTQYESLIGKAKSQK
jgi:hypothetical protein